MKVTISVPETKMVKRKIAVTDYSLIPGWIFNGHMCPVCHWAIENHDVQVMAANTEEAGVLIIHKDCFEKGNI